MNLLQETQSLRAAVCEFWTDLKADVRALAFGPPIEEERKCHCQHGGEFVSGVECVPGWDKVGHRCGDKPCTPEHHSNIRFYGGEGTIHDTNHLDIETHNGEVVAVWFRCQHLPFKQSNIDESRAEQVDYVHSSKVPKIIGLRLEDQS